MNSSDSKKNTESVEKRESIISIRIQMLAAALSRKCPDELVDVFKRHLNKFSIAVLSKAFTRAEQELDKFPPPRVLMIMCTEAMPSEAWKYNFEPGYDPDGIPCLIDPDPWCDNCRRSISEHPNTICSVFTDELNARYMYRQSNCREGSAFLAKLKDLAGRR